MNMLTLAAVAALIAGIALVMKSDKDRQESGEWSNSLQWGYLIAMVGVFGILSAFMSFTAVLLIFTVVTGVIWVWRKVKVDKSAQDTNHFRDYMGGFFPIILVVFLLRTFIAEPFQIPSSSMRPGLIVGDFILVNKFAYGIRTPIINNVIIPTGKIERGDVVVFNYPANPQVNYIKRAIGLPGDVVEYKDKRLTINGLPVQDADTGQTYDYMESIPSRGAINLQAQQWHETLNGKTYTVLKMPQIPPVVLPELSNPEYTQIATQRDQNCVYEPDGSGFTCKVPEGHYFMMGDNRDNSADSRYWGFVDDKLIVGKAFLVWMNLGDFSRIGNAIN